MAGDNKLILRMIYCLILISDSIMVPCYGSNALNIKGCTTLVSYV